MKPIEKLEELRGIVLGDKIDHPAWDWMNAKFDSLRDDIAAQQIILQKYCVECGQVSGRASFGGSNAFHFWCWLRWLWRGLTKRTPDVATRCPQCDEGVVGFLGPCEMRGYKPQRR